MHFHKYFHWVYYDLNKKHVYNFSTALFIWLFLLLTRPFGIYTRGLLHFVSLSGLLLVVSLSFLVSGYSVDFIINKVRRINIQNHKTDFIVWIVKLVLFVHLIYILRLYRCEFECFSWMAYGEQWFANILMLTFTYVPFMLYGKMRFIASGRTSSRIRIRGKGKESLLVDPSKVVYIKADDNYVDIYFLDGDGKQHHQILRSTMSSLEEEFRNLPHLKRIHRSYIVNEDFIASVKSSALKLQLGEEQKEFPVSEKYRVALKGLAF